MAGFWDQAVIEQVQAANNIVDVIGEYVGLARRGSEMVGLCPFHDDHRPSLYVNESKQIFKCFACGAGGDVIKFVQLKEGLSFAQAVERLAERAGMRLRPAGTGHGPVRQGLDRNALAKVNEWAARYFQSCLADKLSGQKARDYLDQRAISPDSRSLWRIGYAPADPASFLQAARRQGITDQALREAGLLDGFGRSRFAGRLIFPISDVTGRVVGFGARTLDDDPVKYINSPNTQLFSKGNCLYGLALARQAIIERQTAIVVEGYTDCIMAHQLGCRNVVATLGTSLTNDHGRILRRYGKRIVLVFDGDQAGQAASSRALEVCLRQRIDISIVTIPDGKDPCEFLLDHGSQAFEQLIDNAVDVLAYKWRQLEGQLNSDQTWAGRRSAIDSFLQTVAMASWAGQISIVDRGLLVNRLAKILGLEARQVDTELISRIDAIARGRSGKLTAGEKGQALPGRQGLRQLAEREVLEVLINAPMLFDQVKVHVGPADFSDPALKAVAEILFDYLCQDGGKIGPEALAKGLMLRTEGPELAGLIAEMAQEGQRKGNFELRLAGAMEILTKGRDQSAPCGENRRSLGIIV